MPVYKDQKRGTWYVSVGYKNSESERCRTTKRGFATKKAASEWEMSFRYKKSKSMFKTFGEFWLNYSADIKPRIRKSTWDSKEHVVRTKADFDFEQKVVSISKTFTVIRKEEIITKPKTQRSFRKVWIPESLANELEIYFDSLYLEDDERIFRISKTSINSKFQKYIEESKMSRIRIHDLRHSHISLLIHMGFSAVAIGERVGHKSERITYYYAHLFPGEGEKIAEGLNNEMSSPYFQNQ